MAYVIRRLKTAIDLSKNAKNEDWACTELDGIARSARVTGPPTLTSILKKSSNLMHKSQSKRCIDKGMKIYNSWACANKYIFDTVFYSAYKDIIPVKTKQKGQTARLLCCSVDLLSDPNHNEDLNSQISKTVNSLFDKQISLEYIIKPISNRDNNSQAQRLAFVAQHVPCKVVRQVAEDTSRSISDEKVTIAIERMMNWLKMTQVDTDIWIMSFLEAYASAEKVSVLNNVTTLTKVKQVVGSLHQTNVPLQVLEAMLVIFQDSPDAFDKVEQCIPPVLESLKRFAEKHGKMYDFLNLKSLLRTMMLKNRRSINTSDSISSVQKNPPPPAVEYREPDVRERTTEGIVEREHGVNKKGLVNRGNTCYANSVIQSLFMQEDFRTALLTTCNNETRSVLTSLQSLFLYLIHTEIPVVDPYEFLRVSIPPWFSVGAQQDCSEFLRYILDTVHEESKQRDRGHKGVVEQYFFGKARNVMTCLRCSDKDVKEEGFADLSLPLPQVQPLVSKRVTDRNVSCIGRSDTHSLLESVGVRNDPVALQQLIDNLLQPEIFEKQYLCKKCDSLENAQKIFEIDDAPQILVLTLLRFSYDVRLRRKRKIMTKVFIPETIHVPCQEKPYTQQAYATHDSTRDRYLTRERMHNSHASNGVRSKYVLTSVIMHAGSSAESGHYFCLARPSTEERMPERHGTGQMKDQWYLFDDSRVSLCNRNYINSDTASGTPYVLFYKKDVPAADDRKAAELQTPPVVNQILTQISEDNSTYLSGRNRYATANDLGRESKRDRSSTSSNNSGGAGCFYYGYSTW